MNTALIQQSFSISVGGCVGCAGCLAFCVATQTQQTRCVAFYWTLLICHLRWSFINWLTA